jgi:purine-binding chemotaxis protein CheW
VNEPSLILRADAHLCAIPLDRVLEVMRPLPTEAIAGAAPFVSGMCVVRGEPAPVVNLGLLLGGSSGRPTRYVTVRDDERSVALAVDEVVGIRDLPPDSLREMSTLLASARSQLVAMLGVVGTDPLRFLGDARLVPELARP